MAGANTYYKAYKRRCIWLALGLPIGGAFFTFILPAITGDTIICVFYRPTGYPCAGCGLTRAAGLLLRGEVSQALYMNPMILPVALILTAFWLAALIDLIKKQDVCVNALLKPRFRYSWQRILLFCILGALVLANWGFNLYKHGLGVI